MKRFITIILFFAVFSLSAQDFEERDIDFLTPRGLVLTDLDDDGDLDMIGTASRHIMTWTNDGAGNFTPDTLASFFLTANLGSYEDFNGDGIKEFFFINEGEYKFLRFDGPELAISLPAFSSGNNPPLGPHEIVDLDQDGDLDIVYISNSNNLVAWLENIGDFEFTNNVIDDSFTSPYRVKIGNINDDDELEIIVTANFNAEERNLVFYRKVGTAYVQEQINSPDYTNIADVDVADLNGDGKNDLFTINNGFTEEVRYWLNQGESTIPTFVPTMVMDDLDDGFNLDPADLDGDGDLDWVVASGNTTLYWLEKISTMPLEYNRRVVSLVDSHNDSRIGDLDGDGSLDIVGFKPGLLFTYYANLIPQVPNGVFSPAVQSQRLNIYPTVTSATVNLSLGLESKIGKFELYNVSGKLLKSFTLTGNQPVVDVSQYPAGTYLLFGSVDGVYYQGKLIRE